MNLDTLQTPVAKCTIHPFHTCIAATPQTDILKTAGWEIAEQINQFSAIFTLVKRTLYKPIGLWCGRRSPCTPENPHGDLPLQRSDYHPQQRQKCRCRRRVSRQRKTARRPHRTDP
ncbi:hypothetical protein [Chroococcidiopsis sp. SAG 2025]|uniref:hypothetical protein n=1 Tax=Chroococcidiopsis sp. SAG 2025 TaxID=171389 RepID=UPI0029373AAE|nr:hypothetical protein [Chroococcidiopsis sp. SAG 2025]